LECGIAVREDLGPPDLAVFDRIRPSEVYRGFSAAESTHSAQPENAMTRSPTARSSVTATLLDSEDPSISRKNRRIPS